MTLVEQEPSRPRLGTSALGVFLHAKRSILVVKSGDEGIVEGGSVGGSGHEGHEGQAGHANHDGHDGHERRDDHTDLVVMLIMPIMDDPDVYLCGKACLGRHIQLIPKHPSRPVESVRILT